MRMDLRELINYDPDIMDKPEKVRSYLLDLYPTETARINIISSLLANGVKQAVQSGDDFLRISFCEKFRNLYGFDRELIDECFNLILSVWEASQLASYKKQGTRDLSKADALLEWKLKEIGGAYSILRYIGNDEEVLVPAYVNGVSVKRIERGAFFCARNLKYVEIPDTVTEIGSQIFKSCRTLNKVVLPNHLKLIAEEVFCDCQNLKSVNIPNSIERIAEGAFCGCGSLEKIDLSENNIGKIEAMSFIGCNCLMEMIVPKTVTTIDQSAFYMCKSLKRIDISNVTNIGNHAFSFTGLKEIVLGSGLYQIQDGAFWGCKSLNVYYLGTASKWNEIEIGAGNQILQENVYFYSDTKPCDHTNHYWHYGANGEIIEWN